MPEQKQLGQFLDEALSRPFYWRALLWGFPFDCYDYLRRDMEHSYRGKQFELRLGRHRLNW